MGKLTKEELLKEVDEHIIAVIDKVSKTLPTGYIKCPGCGDMIKEGLKCNNPECSTYKKPEDNIDNPNDEDYIEIVDGKPEKDAE